MKNIRLLELRKFLEFNQEEFGSGLGVTKTAISKLERGERQLTDTMSKLICSTYGVSESWLKNGEGDMFPPMNVNERIMANLGTILGSGDELKKQFVSIMIELAKDDRFWEVVKPTVNKALTKLEE